MDDATMPNFPSAVAVERLGRSRELDRDGNKAVGIDHEDFHADLHTNRRPILTVITTATSSANAQGDPGEVTA
jgi:hypothetical protein